MKLEEHKLNPAQNIPASAWINNKKYTFLEKSHMAGSTDTTKVHIFIIRRFPIASARRPQ
ncbi:MAG: hypothetical protein A2Z58_03515 [Planctomycetes bacterium RIFCSPHIGHO2_12_42_15]|nr:MAG: hypothetical protein A2Z58_03515 [Planctomycetes bacterium RIFCSPHIGHO2_12_42_15]